MNTFFVTTEEAETKLSKDLLPHTTHCECGQSSGYIDEKNNCNIVVCNSCHDNATNRERFF